MELRRVDVQDGINVIIDNRFCALFPKDTAPQIDYLIEKMNSIFDEDDQFGDDEDTLEEPETEPEVTKLRRLLHCVLSGDRAAEQEARSLLYAVPLTTGTNRD